MVLGKMNIGVFNDEILYEQHYYFVNSEGDMQRAAALVFSASRGIVESLKIRVYPRYMFHGSCTQ